jgi:hypothetical protein
VEAVFVQQIPLYQNRPIVVDPNTGTTFLTTSDLDGGFAPGGRALFGLRMCNGLAVEFSYLGLFQSGSTQTEKPNASSYLIFPNNYAGNVFVNMDGVQPSYSSRVNSFELNFPCCCRCCTRCDSDACGNCGETASCEYHSHQAACNQVRCSSLEWFAGVRYLDIDNGLNMAVSRNENGGVETGTYDIQATNHLIGGQLGARLRRTIHRFGWELTGKAGVFSNDANQTQSVIDYPNFPLRPTTSSQGYNTAFVGEINLSGIYRMTDVLSIKAGYNAIWIEGLALAPDQLDFNFAASPSGNQLHTGGGLLVHGLNVGLEARW